MKKIYIVAALTAVLTGVAVYLYAAYLDKKATVVVEQGTVVVALAPIDENVKITADMVTLKSTAKEWVGPDAVTKLDGAVGKFNKYRVAAGQQLTNAGLAEAGSADPGGQLSYVLEKGMRAVTIATDELSGVGYYISKNDHVDILHTESVTETDDKGSSVSYPVTELLLQNVKVLEVASRQQNATAAKDTPNYAYGSVTFAVSPEDAVKLFSASRNGQIYLALRAAQDDAKVTIPAYIDPYLAPKQ